MAAAEGERREGSYLDGSQNPVFDAADHWYPRAVRRMTAGPGRPMDQADGPGPSPELGSTLAPPPPPSDPRRAARTLSAKRAAVRGGPGGATEAAASRGRRAGGAGARQLALAG